jgi:hypothetical protein
MCSFWFIECLSRAGDVEKARFLFEKMLGYANHVGLYAEQVGRSGEHLGNFPQAFTHLALISAAFDLDRRLSGSRGSPDAASGVRRARGEPHARHERLGGERLLDQAGVGGRRRALGEVGHAAVA